MLNQFSRTELLLGKEALDKLAGSRVAVFGIGGVVIFMCQQMIVKLLTNSTFCRFLLSLPLDSLLLMYK